MRKLLDYIINTIGSLDNLIEKYNDILQKIEEIETKFYLLETNSSITTKLKDLIIFEKGKKPNSLDEDGPLYLTIDTLEGNEPLYTKSNRVVSCVESNVLMVMDGASSGKVYIGNKGVVGSTLSLIKTKNINEYYLYIFLKNNYNNIKDRNTGSAIPHTNKEFVLSLDIPMNNIDNSIYNKLLKYKISIIKNINKLKTLKSVYLNKFFK